MPLMCRKLTGDAKFEGRDALGPRKPFGPGGIHRSVDAAFRGEDGSKP